MRNGEEYVPSLCWRCKNAIGGCDWSKHFKPVKGWDAEPTKVQLSNGHTHDYADSFLVKSCPEFVPDEEE